MLGLGFLPNNCGVVNRYVSQPPSASPELKKWQTSSASPKSSCQTPIVIQLTFKETIAVIYSDKRWEYSFHYSKYNQFVVFLNKKNVDLELELLNH